MRWVEGLFDDHSGEEGWPLREIAELFGVSAMTIKRAERTLVPEDD